MEIKVTKKLGKMAEMLLDGVAERVIYTPSLPIDIPFRPSRRASGRTLVVELSTVTVEDVALNGLAVSYGLKYSQVDSFIDITVSPFFRPDWQSVSGYFHPHINGSGRMCGDDARSDAYSELKRNGIGASVLATYANMHMIKDDYLDRDDWHWLYFRWLHELEPGHINYDTAMVWILARARRLGKLIPMVFTEEYLMGARAAMERLEEKGRTRLPYGHRWYGSSWANINDLVEQSISGLEDAEGRWESLLERSYIWQK